jgi:hypothetical protein
VPHDNSAGPPGGAASAVLAVGPAGALGLFGTPVSGADGSIVLGRTAAGESVTLTARSVEWLDDLEDAVRPARGGLLSRFRTVGWGAR